MSEAIAKDEQAVALKDLLRESREDMGYSRKQLAEVTGIPFKSLEKFERGEMEPTLSRAFTLARALEIPFENIREEVEGDTPEDETANSGTITRARKHLEQASRATGMELRTSDHGNPGPMAAGLQAPGGEADQPEMGLRAELQEFATEAQAGKLKPVEIQPRLRRLRRQLRGEETVGLVDIARDHGIEAEDEDFEQDEQTRDALIDRILVRARYGMGITKLSPDGLVTLTKDLLSAKTLKNADLVEPEEREKPTDAERAQIANTLAPALVLAMLQNRAPDISSKRYDITSARYEKEGERKSLFEKIFGSDDEDHEEDA
jgi:transcriptional regulator with XRE-family HTH domain